MTQRDRRRVHVLVTGQVQGVGYRMATCRAAEALDLQGWVRNLLDGRVEAVFEGRPERIDEIIRWCHQGVRSAVVTDVAVTDEEPEDVQGFYIRR